MVSMNSYLSPTSCRWTTAILTVLVSLGCQPALACVERGFSKQADEAMSEYLDLEEIVTIKLLDGTKFAVPSGHLTPRRWQGIAPKIDPDKWGKGLAFSFCFPNGEISLPDLTQYLPFALQEYKDGHAPVMAFVIKVANQDPDEVEYFERITRAIQREMHDKNFTSKIEKIYGLTKGTNRIGAQTYVLENDADYAGYIKTSKMNDTRRGLASAEIVNKKSGYKIEFKFPFALVAEWRSIVEVIENKHAQWRVVD